MNMTLDFTRRTSYPDGTPAIRKLAYELYKIDWERRINTDQKLDVLKDYFDEALDQMSQTGTDDAMGFSEYFEEVGYSGSAYACYEEFEESEYLDRDYMRGLLNDTEYAIYSEDAEALGES